jgi:transposase-like protein
MPTTEHRSFSREFKLKTLERIERGETIAAQSKELGVHRQLIYKWKNAFRDGATPAPVGRPSKQAAMARRLSEPIPDELELARRRIAELERKVGQQALELDFFQNALQRIKASRQLSTGPGVTASSPRSKR